MARTYGQTRNCGGCRFWSEMVARFHGVAIEAMCLSPEGPRSSQYTTERATCSAWKIGHLGAVDDPPNYGEETRAAYAAEDDRDAA